MNWINWAWIGGGLLGSLIVGLIIGRIVAGIKSVSYTHLTLPTKRIV